MAGALLLAVAPAAADTFFWDGGGTDSNWTTPENWIGDVAPEPGSDLVFGSGKPRRTNTNDYESGTVFVSITLGAVDYVLDGNALTLIDGIVASTSATSTVGPRINCDLTLFTDQVVLDSGNSPLTLAGAVEFFGTITFDTASADISILGSLSGDGKIQKQGLGELVLAGDSSYTGQTWLQEGEMLILSASALGASDPEGSNETLAFTGTTLRIGDVAEPIAEPFGLYGGELRAETGSLLLTGAIFLDGSPAIRVESGTTLDLEGAMKGPGGFAKRGGGELYLKGEAKSFADTVMVEDGALYLGLVVNDSTAAGDVVVLPGAFVDQSGYAGSELLSSSGGTICIGCQGQGKAATGGIALDNATFQVHLGGTINDGSYSRLDVSGSTIDLGGSVLDVRVSFVPPPEARFVIIDGAIPGAVSGQFANLPQGAKFEVSGIPFTISYNSGLDGGDVVLESGWSQFLDGFESGNVAAWSSATGFTGNLATFAAAEAGNFELPPAVNGSLEAFGTIELVAIGADRGEIGRLRLAGRAQGGIDARLFSPADAGSGRVIDLRRLPGWRASGLNLEWRTGERLLLLDGDAVIDAVEDRRVLPSPLAAIELRRVAAPAGADVR